MLKAIVRESIFTVWIAIIRSLMASIVGIAVKSKSASGLLQSFITNLRAHPFYYYRTNCHTNSQ